MAKAETPPARPGRRCWHRGKRRGSRHHLRLPIEWLIGFDRSTASSPGGADSGDHCCSVPRSPARWPGARPLDREHPGVQPVACRSQAARSGEPVPPDAVLLSRLSLERSVPGVWLLRAGIQMSVPSWCPFPALSARQHLVADDRDQCGACHSGADFLFRLRRPPLSVSSAVWLRTGRASCSG